MSDNQQKRKINMSKQTCNYCKGLGHRIHAMDAFGVYLVGAEGGRVLACPVLVEKESLKSREVDEEFPSLPGQKGVAASAATLALPRAIAAAVKNQKRTEWLLAKELNKQKKREWEERHVERMKNKYGDLWHREVAGKNEDCDVARNLRSDECHTEYCEEGRLYQEETEIRAKWEKEDKEREERRAAMTEEEKRQEEKEWEDAVETGYQKEQDAMDYWRKTGIWSY